MNNQVNHNDETAIDWDQFGEEQDNVRFIQEFNKTAEKCWQNAEDKGFHKSQRGFPEECALFHSEISEALEGHRHGSGPSDHIPDFCCEEEELADVIIRIMDTAKTRKWRVAEAILAKMKFNSSRPYMHGKKL